MFCVQKSKPPAVIIRVAWTETGCSWEWRQGDGLSRFGSQGVTALEIERTLNEGWEAPDAKPGTSGKSMVFPYGAEWEGQFYDEKEVTVYYKTSEDQGVIVLTVKARYGTGFPRRDAA